jgi:hypothetical protein
MREVASIALLLALAVPLTGCGATPALSTAPPTSTSADPHAGHSDPLADAVRQQLTQTFDMTFESAGPHHTLGKAPDGVQLDLVGVPVVQVVLSVPGHDPATVKQDAEPYLDYLPRLLGEGADQSIGRDLLLESMTTWDGSTELDKRRSADGFEARLTSTSNPAYVVLSVARS